MAELKDLALAYAHNGWPVFPCEPRGKQPLGRLAPHGLKDATVDADLVSSWWQSEPEANIGIPTGVAFDVVDLDGEEAVRRFQTICREHGDDPKRWPRAATGGGGRHLLIQPTGQGNRVALLPGVDFRGKGGYIVAPGSVHPSGQPYRWLRQGDPVPAPDWLLQLLRPAIEDRRQGSSRSAERPSPAYIGAAVEYATDEVRGAAEGTRNHALNRAAFSIGQLVGAGWLPRHWAEAALKDAAYACGLTEPETSRTIRSGLDAGAMEPRQPPPGGWSRADDGGLIRSGSQAGNRPEPVDLGGSVGGSQAVPTYSGTDGNRPEPEVFDALVEPYPIWAAKSAEKVPALVPGILGAGGIGFLVSDPKAGKTWFGLELVISVLSGKPFLHRYPVERTGRVLYIATEGSREGSLARLKALAKGHDDEACLDRLDFIWRRQVYLDDEPFRTWLLQRAGGYVLIVVDVLADAWSGDENKSNQVAALMRGIRPIADLGTTVLLLHHLSKQQPDNQRSIWQRIRGSTTLFGAFDSGIGLERAQGQQRTKVSFQHRDDVAPDPFSFAWPEELVTGEEPVKLSWAPLEVDLEALQSAEDKILRTAQQHPGLTRSELAKVAGGRRQANLEAIRALVASGLLQLGTAQKGSRHIEVVNVADNPSGSQSREPVPDQPVPAPSDDGFPMGVGVLRTPPMGTRQNADGNSSKTTPQQTTLEGTQANACPACGKVDFEPLSAVRLRCSCGEEYSRS